MEKHEKEYLDEIAPELTDLITLYQTIIARLVSKRIWDKEDSAALVLDEIPNKIKKKYKFLEILKNKLGAYDLLIEALKEVKQDAAANLLEQIPKKTSTTLPSNTAAPSVSTVQQCTMKQSSGKRRYSLNFGDHDIFNTVMPKVRDDLLAKMNSKEANTRMLTKLASLNYFDHSEIELLISGSHTNQQDRMVEFFAKLANLDESEILDCFEKLCNLDDQPKASERFRKVFKMHYPDCVILSSDK